MNASRITSRSNPRIVHVKKLLADKRYRYERRQYAAEGVRVLDNASAVRELFVCEGVPVPPVPCAAVHAVSPAVFKTISTTEHSQGVVAVLDMRLFGPDRIDRNGRYVLLDRLQDPGNVGTIIRTAGAFGIDGIIVTPGSADPFSPKTVRAAASVMDKIDVIAADAAALAGCTVIAADLRGEDARSFPWPDAFVLAIGNEANGISDEVRAVARSVVSLPLSGDIESLNAAVSAAIVLYCALNR